MPSSDTPARPNLNGVSILLVEDDPAYALGLVRLLERAAARVTLAETLESTLHWLSSEIAWDVILLDQLLPDGDAIDALTTINQLSPRPAVVATSAALQDAKRSLALQDSGVVLLPKPFVDADLFLAITRARSVASAPASRSSAPPPASSSGRHGSGQLPTLCFGPITLDLVSQTASVDGARVDLQPTQVRLLAQLLASPGRALSLAELIEGTFRGTHHDGGGNLRYQVHELRRKLGSAGKLIETSPGGYGMGLGGHSTPSSLPPGASPGGTDDP